MYPQGFLKEASAVMNKKVLHGKCLHHMCGARILCSMIVGFFISAWNSMLRLQ
jgi:hypothetical protein